MSVLPSRRLWTVIALLALAAAGVAAVVSLGAWWIDDSEETQRLRRLEMVAVQIEARGVRHKGVLEAMRKVPRHRFVPTVWKGLAYEDRPLPIGDGQTISQPYIVGWMTELIEPAREMRVLEVGTGSGYQAAVLAECVGEVDSIEVIPALGKRAKTCWTSWGVATFASRSATATKAGPIEHLTMPSF
jgi:protein-L-isoaspartate(D-aspartate) O-methyltransferase